MIVRDAKPEDALEVAGVHVCAWQAAYRELLDQGYLDSLRAEDRAARYRFDSTDPASPRTILAFEDGAIRGFASYGHCSDQDLPGCGELYALYVDPPHWETGIGRLLMGHAHRRLRALGFEQAVLWVLDGNEHAERFYRTEGWTPDGSRRTEAIWNIEVEVARFRHSTL